MIVFKYFLKVLNKAKAPIIIYTVFLIFFGAFSLKTNDMTTNFTATKPNIFIVNKDENEGITKNLINYLKINSNIKDIENNKDALNDALFYRDISYIIYIPENYRTDFLNGKRPIIEVKGIGDYQASYAEMLLNKYLKVASLYQSSIQNESELINKINDSLKENIEVEVTSKLDTNSLSQASFYYNFASYSILAGSVYVICIIMSSFKDKKINKRTLISSMDYKKHNRYLLLSNFFFAFILWLFYVLISFILIKDAMFTTHGLFYMLNSFIFTLCSVTIAFLISNLVINKEAINGIVNVVALGSSFLCGAFVPAEWLPNSVLTFAHILPSYWFIQSNIALETVETFNFISLKPIFINMLILIIFIVIFVIINNFVSKRKMKID